jgi:hypothetical protein
MMFQHGGGANRWCKAVVIACAATLACANALASGGNFQVTARVVGATPAFDALDAFPVPAGAMRLHRSRLSDSYFYPGVAERAARELAATLPARGYRLEHASADGHRQHWRSARHRLVVRLDPVLGAQPATRIVVEADALG